MQSVKPVCVIELLVSILFASLVRQNMVPHPSPDIPITPLWAVSLVSVAYMMLDTSVVPVMQW